MLFIAKLISVYTRFEVCASSARGNEQETNRENKTNYQTLPSDTSNNTKAQGTKEMSQGDVTGPQSKTVNKCNITCIMVLCSPK